MGECLDPVNFLVAEDDEEDRELIQMAIEIECDCYRLKFVGDGQELLDYLRRDDSYAYPLEAPAPDLILLDLNMPRKDGLSALHEIKSDPDFKVIPIIIFTTTQEEEAVASSYGRGANTFIPKPVTFDDLTRTIRCLSTYWCKVATLPRASMPECRF